jgi:hypothetical protein
VRERSELSDIITYRDKMNRPMSRAEVINIVMEISGCVCRKKADNHYAYLVRKKLLKGLKRGGRVVSAQKTTTKRSQITVEQQLRWHGTIESVWDEQARLNQPSEEFEVVKEHFTTNLDESNLRGNEGTIKVIASSSKSKTEKNMDDSRDAVTVVRVGAAGGGMVPGYFFCSRPNYGQYCFSGYR